MISQMRFLIRAALDTVNSVVGSDSATPTVISEDIQQLRDSEQDQPVTVLMYPTDSRDSLRNDLETIIGYNGSIESVGDSALRATVSTSLLDYICSLSSLKSIDIERDASR